MTKLTSKQQIVLEFVERFCVEQRQAPLIREIQAGCRIASYKSTIDRLNALERKGYFKRAPNKHRGIRLLRKPSGPALSADPAEAASRAGESNGSSAVEAPV